MNKTKVLLILTQDVLDRARVLAGKATTALKLPVSLQIVLRALIEVGLKRDNHPALRANVESQAKAVRHQRSVAGRAGLGGTDSRGVGHLRTRRRQPSGTAVMIEDKTYGDPAGEGVAHTKEGERADVPDRPNRERQYGER
jgi:hypothetical protein